MHEEFRQEVYDEAAHAGSQRPPRSSMGWMTWVLILLACGVVVSLGYAFHERHNAEQLTLRQDQMAAAMNQTLSALDGLTAKVNSISVPPPSQPSASAVQPAGSPQMAPPHRKARLAPDPRWKRMQQELADQQKQIESTQQDLDKTRTDMANNLSGAKEDLNGSIARNHAELVALEKKGERSYFEFDLSKSKQFHHVGSISLSLRKVNEKHDYYDIAMIVDDSELGKKHVNLYEPVWVYPADSHQPMELVVNRISRDGVHGYVSEPKYNQTESAANIIGSQPSSAGSSMPAPSASNEPAKADSTLSHRPDSQP